MGARREKEIFLVAGGDSSTQLSAKCNTNNRCECLCSIKGSIKWSTLTKAGDSETLLCTPENALCDMCSTLTVVAPSLGLARGCLWPWPTCPAWVMTIVICFFLNCLVTCWVTHVMLSRHNPAHSDMMSNPNHPPCFLPRHAIVDRSD